MWNALMSVATAVFVALMVALMNKEMGDRAKEVSLVESVIFGLVAGIISAAAPISGLWSVLLFMMTVLMVIYFIVRWHQEGDRLREFFPYAMIQLTLMWLGKATTAIFAASLTSAVAAEFFRALPTAMLAFSLGYAVFTAVAFRSEQAAEKEETRMNAKPLAITSIAIFGITVVIAAAMVLTPMVRAMQAQPDDTPEVVKTSSADADDVKVTVVDKTAKTASATAKDGTEAVTITKDSGAAQAQGWAYFFNSELQGDADEENDYNFGPTAAIDGGIDQTKVAEVNNDFRARLKSDPALGAADMAWLDAIVKTRYLGVFYDECNEHWDATMNKAKEEWIADEAAYRQTLDAYFEFLDHASKVEVTRESGLDDQMYMNPFTANGVPDIIVMETTEHDGWFLTYTFKIKNTTEVKVSYRIDCGYQPTNVATIMNITPIGRKNPPTYTPPATTKNPPTTTPPTTPPVTPPSTPPGKIKDPSQGTTVIPNDDPGPGDWTGDGNGGAYSTEDRPDNSNHMTPQEYKDTIDELKKVNETQKTGDDDNTPTYRAPTGTTVDNNGDTGNGGDPINTPTPVDKSTETVGGRVISNDPAGVPWGGPAN